MRHLFIGAIAAASLLSCAGSASAAVVAIQNADFSQGRAQSDGEFSPGHVAGPTGWGASGGSSTGHWNPTAAQFSDEAAHGGVGWAHNSGGLTTGTSPGMMAQTVQGHTILANTRYTLTMDVGRRGDIPGAWEYQLGLMSGAFNTGTAAIFASLIGSADASGAEIPAGVFRTVSFAFETGANDPFIGQQLSILMLGRGVTGAAFDNVILDASPLSVSAVPEPATWAMMITGFGLAGSMIRTRRRSLALA